MHTPITGVPPRESIRIENINFMEIRMKVCFTLGMFGALVLAASDVQDNFNANDWGNWKTDSARGLFQRNAEEGKNAPGALEIQIGEGNPAKSSFCFIKRFDGVPGKTYQAEIFAKVKDFSPDGTVTFVVQAMDEKGKYLGTVVSSSLSGKSLGSWRKLSVNFTVPQTGEFAQTKLLQFLPGCSNASAGSVFFDDFVFRGTDISKSFSDAFDSSCWDGWKAPDTKGEFFHNAEVGGKEPGCLEAKILPGNPKQVSLSFLKRLPVKRGGNYTFVVFVRKGKDVPDNAVFGLGIQGQDAKNLFTGTGVKGTSVKGSALSGEEWKRLVLTFKVPENGPWATVENVLVTLSFSSQTPCSGYFDDFSFFEDEE